MFPDEKKMNFVNVEGTSRIIILYPCSKYTGTVCLYLPLVVALPCRYRMHRLLQDKETKDV